MKHPSTHQISSVIEWSPSQVSAYHVDSKSTNKSDSIASLNLGPTNGHANIVAISRRTVFIKPVRVPNSSEADIRQILRIQLDQLFPVQQGELAYDLWLTSNVNQEGRLAVVCGIKAETLRELDGQLAKASIRPTKVLPVCLGALLIARSMGQSECAVVDHVREGLSIDLISGNELLYSRVVPYHEGKTNIAQEIARTFAIASVEPMPIIACSGIDVPGATLQSSESTLSALSSHQTFGFNVKIEPPEAAIERKNLRAKNRMRLAVMLCGAAAVLWVGVFLRLSDTTKDKAKNQKVWLDRIDSLKKRESRLSAEVKKTGKVVDVLTKGFEPAQHYADVMAAIGNSTPSTVWVTGLTIERGKRLSLRGSSINSDGVSKLLKNLTQDQRFRDVKLAFANNGLIEATPIVQFSLSSHVVGNLPLAEQDKNKRKK